MKKKKKRNNIHYSVIIVVGALLLFVVMIGRVAQLALSDEVDGINLQALASKRTTRTWKPNLRTVKAVVNGTPKKMTVCSRCLRSGLVERA